MPALRHSISAKRPLPPHIVSPHSGGFIVLCPKIIKIVRVGLSLEACFLFISGILNLNDSAACNELSSTSIQNYYIQMSRTGNTFVTTFRYLAVSPIPSGEMFNGSRRWCKDHSTHPSRFHPKVC